MTDTPKDRPYLKYMTQQEYRTRIEGIAAMILTTTYRDTVAAEPEMRVANAIGIARELARQIDSIPGV